MIKITLHKMIANQIEELTTVYEPKTKDEAEKTIKILLNELEELEEQGEWGAITIITSEK